MLPTGPATQVYLALGTTDLRKGFEGLGDLVRHQMKEDPMRGYLSVCLYQSKSNPHQVALLGRIGNLAADQAAREEPVQLAPGRGRRAGNGFGTRAAVRACHP